MADSPAGDATPLPRSDTSPASQHVPLNPRRNVEPGPVSAADSAEIETGSNRALQDGASAPSPPAFVPPAASCQPGEQSCLRLGLAAILLRARRRV